MACALLRATFPLLGTHGSSAGYMSAECGHGTLESVRHLDAETYLAEGPLRFARLYRTDALVSGASGAGRPGFPVSMRIP